MGKAGDAGADVGAEGLSLQTRGLSQQGARDLLGGHLPGNPVDRIRVVNESPRLGAMAYTRGADIHVSPSDQRHLPHEAWHAVQQASGRVRRP